MRSCWLDCFFSCIQAIDGSAPLQTKGKPLVLEGAISLKRNLQQLVKEHIDSSPPLRIYDEIPEKLTDGRREAIRPELLFELFLRERLTAIRKQREWLILPDRQVWRERASQKTPEPHSIVRTAC